MHGVFIDLVKAYETVRKYELWYSLWHGEVGGKYVRVTPDIYADCETRGKQYSIVYPKNRLSEFEK